MKTADDLSTYAVDLLTGTYDCVDRISVRGYYPLGQTSGGLLTWWNQLFPNRKLTEQGLRKLAGDFARRVNGYARKHKIALRYFATGDRTKQKNFALPMQSSEGCLRYLSPKHRPWSGKPKTIGRAKWCCAGPRTGRWSITTTFTLSIPSGDM